MRSLTSTHNDVATSQTRPKPPRVGTRWLARGQYAAMTHLQHSAVLVLDVDIPSHSTGRRSEARHQQVYVLLHRWAEHKRGMTWIRVNLLTGTCHLLWLIGPICAAAEAISANTRLLTAARAAGRTRRPDMGGSADEVGIPQGARRRHSAVVTVAGSAPHQ